MNTIYFDSRFDDNERRRLLFDGQIFVYAPTDASRQLCEFAQGLAREAFAPHDPREAEHQLPSDEYVAILAKLKPTFVHHPEAKVLLRGVLAELGCDLAKTYFDVPRLKTVATLDHQSSGLSTGIHPHRDSWYSAPLCQLNWWLPVFDIGSASALAFHPHYWQTPVRNSSSRFNHYLWNQGARKAAAVDKARYSESQPRPEEPIAMDPQVRFILPVGGVILFAGAQLHSAVPNTSGRTRFSIDFRTVHHDDLAERRGAPNVDTAATGTTLRDFMNVDTLERLPERIVQLYDDETAAAGELVFQAGTAR
jgi:hypothetical protein